jgi:hypothetical protein
MTCSKIIWLYSGQKGIIYRRMTGLELNLNQSGFYRLESSNEGQVLCFDLQEIQVILQVSSPIVDRV